MGAWGAALHTVDVTGSLQSALIAAAAIEGRDGGAPARPGLGDRAAGQVADGLKLLH